MLRGRLKVARQEEKVVEEEEKGRIRHWAKEEKIEEWEGPGVALFPFPLVFLVYPFFRFFHGLLLCLDLAD